MGFLLVIIGSDNKQSMPAMQETWVRSLGWEDPLEKGMATHSGIVAWRISWTIHDVTKSQTWLSSLHFTSGCDPCSESNYFGYSKHKYAFSLFWTFYKWNIFLTFFPQQYLCEVLLYCCVLVDGSVLLYNIPLCELTTVHLLILFLTSIWSFSVWAIIDRNMMSILVPYVGEQIPYISLGYTLRYEIVRSHWTHICSSLSSFGKSVFQSDCKELEYIWGRVKVMCSYIGHGNEWVRSRVWKVGER